MRANRQRSLSSYRGHPVPTAGRGRAGPSFHQPHPSSRRPHSPPLLVGEGWGEGQSTTPLTYYRTPVRTHGMGAERARLPLQPPPSSSPTPIGDPRSTVLPDSIRYPQRGAGGDPQPPVRASLVGARWGTGGAATSQTDYCRAGPPHRHPAPPTCHPKHLLLSPRAPSFVIPSEAEGPETVAVPNPNVH